MNDEKLNRMRKPNWLSTNDFHRIQWPLGFYGVFFCFVVVAVGQCFRLDQTQITDDEDDDEADMRSSGNSWPGSFYYTLVFDWNVECVVLVRNSHLWKLITFDVFMCFWPITPVHLGLNTRLWDIFHWIRSVGTLLYVVIDIPAVRAVNSL